MRKQVGESRIPQEEWQDVEPVLARPRPRHEDSRWGCAFEIGDGFGNDAAAKIAET